jgi:hypothetical protein
MPAFCIFRPRGKPLATRLRLKGLLCIRYLMLDLGRQIQMPEQLEQTNLREIICPAAT